jgi:Fe-S-cluster-containing hydrogenase component 2
MYVDDNCVGCGLCVESCPVEAIQLIDNKAVINKEICIDCASCVDVCPLEAIHQED